MAKFLFVVQGEGRGHLTQALALQDILHNAGHKVVAVLVGKSYRKIPDFFIAKMQAPLHYFESPNFVKDSNNRSILIGKTISYNLLKTRTFFASMRELSAYYEQYQPDVIINFYDLLAGFYNLFHKTPAPMVVVGHQFFLQHPQFEYPQGHKVEKFLLNLNTNLTAHKAKLKLALSFAPYLSDYKNIKILPPLLRKEVLSLSPETQDFILCYVNNDGYGDDIIAWHKQNPDVKLECFWDRKNAPEVEHFSENLTFHQISDTKFLEKMRTCRGLVTTAGFESVCEAMYLGKPVMMIPVEGQFEQSCNALDAQKAGAGIVSKDFNITPFLNYLEIYQPTTQMRDWVQKAPEMFVESLEKIL